MGTPAVLDGDQNLKHILVSVAGLSTADDAIAAVVAKDTLRLITDDVGAILLPYKLL